MGSIALLHLQDSCAPLPRLWSPLEWTRKVGAQSSANKTLLPSCAAVTEGSLAEASPSSAPLAVWVFCYFYSFLLCSSTDRFSCGKVFLFQRAVAFSHHDTELRHIVCGAARQSWVSDYKPCAEEPPAQNASLWGRNSTRGSGGTRQGAEESVQRQKEFYRGPHFPSHGRSEDISSLSSSSFSVSSPLFSAGQHTQLLSLTDERELGTSLGKKQRILSKGYGLVCSGFYCYSECHRRLSQMSFITRYLFIFFCFSLDHYRTILLDVIHPRLPFF